MPEWSVRVQAQTMEMLDADAIIDALAAYAPAVGVRSGEVSVRLTVGALDVGHAVQTALEAFRTVLPGLIPVAVEAQTADELDGLLGLEPVGAGR